MLLVRRMAKIPLSVMKVERAVAESARQKITKINLTYSDGTTFLTGLQS